MHIKHRGLGLPQAQGTISRFVNTRTLAAELLKGSREIFHGEPVGSVETMLDIPAERPPDVEAILQASVFGNVFRGLRVIDDMIIRVHEIGGPDPPIPLPPLIC